MSIKQGIDWLITFNPEQSPWKAVCRIESNFSGGNIGLGSGCLIGPSSVLTVAHNVHLKGSTVRSIKVLAGYNTDKSFVGSANVLNGNWRYPSSWEKGDSPLRYDYAILHLDKPLGAKIGYFGYARIPVNANITQYKLNIAGYPDFSRFKGSQVRTHGDIDRLTETTIYHSLDTEDGMSGAPVFITTPQGKHYVIGIHSRGPGSYNEARRIDKELLTDIKSWIW